MSEFHYLWSELSIWSQRTFGSDKERGPIGPLKHLIKEANEAIVSPMDITEFADCLILVFDATRRAGFSLDDLKEAALRKHEANVKRVYLRPVGDEVSEHVRD